MIRTIELSPYISVQGLLISNLPSGDVEIALNGRHYVGRPVNAAQIGTESTPRQDVDAIDI
ncbi:MAG: hypothetical protein AAF415_18355 [Pseudomonadota bacterium]